MSDPVLGKKMRLHVAGFRDSTAGKDILSRIGAGAGEALDLIAFSLSHDVGRLPEDLDGEHVGALLDRYLPGRLSGRESYARRMPELLEAFLRFIADEESLTRAWEWSMAVDRHTPEFNDALGRESRPRFASDVKHEPERRPGAKLGRNDPCFCGSGRKYKHCCGKLL